MSHLGLGMSAEHTHTGHRRGRAAVVVALAAIAVLVLGGIVLGAQLLGGGDDYPGPGSGEVQVQVTSGQSARDIGRALEAAGVVKTDDAFVDAAAADDRSRGIQPGFYSLRREMSAAGALDLMLDPASRVLSQVTVPEGLRLTETLDLLAQETGISRADFDAALVDPAPLGLPAYAEGNAEGFLFPARYDIAPDATAASVLTAMVTRFNQAATSLNLEQRAAEAGRTPLEIVTIASLVEAEAPPEDFAKVSRVVANRLEADMPLQFDSTVNYALDRDTIEVSLDDLEVDSPYNTYANKGLPPAPINSPGEAALEAALAPEDGDWVYFVTVDPSTGETKFTASYDEFLTFKDELQANTP